MSCFCFECLVYCLSIFTATEIYIHVIVRRYIFLFNNQPDALIIRIYSVIKLCVSGNSFAHHQEFSTVHSAFVSFIQVLMTVSKHSQDGTQSHPDCA